MNDEDKTKEQLIHELVGLRHRIAKLTCRKAERKQEEEAAEEGFIAHLASFPELNPSPILELDQEGKLSYLNPATKSIFPDLATLGTNHPFLADWTQVVKELQGSNWGKTVTREVVADGLFYEQIISLVSEKQIRIYGSNITERKRAEDNITSQFATIKSIIESYDAPIFSVDRNYCYTSFNSAHAIVMKSIYNQDIEIGKGILDYMTVAEDRITAKANLDRALEGASFTEASYSGEQALSRRYFEVSHNPIKGQNGEVIGVSVFVMDLTERKQAEEALQKSLKLLNDTGKMAKVGGWELDLSTNEVSWTEEVGRIHAVEPGYKPSLEEALDFYAPESRPDVEAVVKRAAETGEPYVLESLFIPRGSKDKIWVRSIGKAIYSGGKIVKLAGTFQDITERKQAEEELRKREATLQKIFDLLPVGLWFADKDGMLLRGNPAGVKIWGAEPKVGPPEYGVFKARRLPSGEDIAPDDWALAHTIKEGITVENELLEIDAFDGQKRIILNFTAPVLDAKGEVQGAIVMNQDITERKRAEEALKESEERYRALIDLGAQSGEAIVMLRDEEQKEGIQVFCSDTWLQITGYSREELRSMSFLELLLPKDHEAALARHRRRMSGESIPGLFELTIIKKDGTQVPIEATSAYSTYRGKRVNVVYVRDITERKRAEESLKNSERKYRELADFLPQTVFELDKRGNFTFTNYHGFQSFGYTPEDVKKGLNALQMFIPEDRVRVKKNIRMVLGGRKLSGNEYTALRRDGSTFPVAVYSAPVIHEGKPAGIRGVIFDLSERKRMETALYKSQEELRNLATHLLSVREEERAEIARGVHDELGQALTALKMDVSWFSKRLPKEQKSLLEKTEVMSGLIDSAVQTVKKISTELRPGILDDFGLIAAIEWQAEEFQKRSGVKCTVSSVNELQMDRACNTAIFRIFQETLTNVARHAKATRIMVNLKSQGGKMTMRIRDNGKGITPEQLSSSSSLGIIGMRERVHALRGEISIRGIPGKGTTVTVAIPLVKKEELNDKSTHS